MKYKLEMRDDCGGREKEEITAADLFDAVEQAEEQANEWAEDGSWGDEGASVTVWWTLADEEGDSLKEGSVVVEIEADIDALIEAAGGDPDCEHDWTAEGEGGCDENPGVWSLGGTKMSFATHCRVCGLHRHETVVGSQRNPGERDTVSFTQPDSWCEECQLEECCCEE